MASCSNCGEALGAGWKFCEHCGAVVDGQCTATTKSGTRCKRKAQPGEAFCATHAETATAVSETAPLPAVGAVPAAVAPEPPPGPPPEMVVTRERRDRSAVKVAVLAAAAAVLLLGLVLGVLNSVGTHRRLDDTREDLTATQRTLDATKAELATRTTERDDLRTKLTAAENELGGTKQSLSETRTRVDAQAGQIDTLKTCLDGVLTALAAETAEEAVRVLDSIENACERAVDLL